MIGEQNHNISRILFNLRSILHAAFEFTLLSAAHKQIAVHLRQMWLKFKETCDEVAHPASMRDAATWLTPGNRCCAVFGRFVDNLEHETIDFRQLGY